jgi:hypothetical protein
LTLGGMFSTLKDNMTMTLTAMGTQMAPAFKNLMEAFSLGAEGTGVFAKAVEITGEVISRTVAAISAMASGISWMAVQAQIAWTKLQMLNLEQSGLTTSDPYKRLAENLKQYEGEADKAGRVFSGATDVFLGREKELNEEIKKGVELKKKSVQVFTPSAGPTGPAGTGKKSEVEIMIEEWEQKAAINVEYGQMVLDQEDFIAEYKQRKDLDAANYHEKILRSKLLMDTRYAAGANAILATSSVFMAQSNIKLFRFGQALAIAQAIMNTAQGITKTLAMWGWPLGVIGAGIIATAGALQVKMIAEQKPPEPPKLQTGTFNVPSAQTYMLHPGEIVTPEPMASAIRRGEAALVGGGGSAGGTNITIQGNVVGWDDFIDEIDSHRNQKAARMGTSNYFRRGVYK